MKLTSFKGDGAVVLVLLACSLSLNVFMAWRMRPVARTTTPLLTVGTRVPSVNAEDVFGKKVRLDWTTPDKRASLVYVFSPSCVWCSRNFDNIKAISAATKGSYRLLGLSLTKEGLEPYLQAHPYDFPIYTNVDKEGSTALRLGPTPTTILVGANGSVEKVWTGAYGGPLGKEVEETLGLHLPGLLPAAGVTAQ